MSTTFFCRSTSLSPTTTTTTTRALHLTRPSVSLHQHAFSKKAKGSHTLLRFLSRSNLPPSSPPQTPQKPTLAGRDLLGTASNPLHSGNQPNAASPSPDTSILRGSPEHKSHTAPHFSEPSTPTSTPPSNRSRFDSLKQYWKSRPSGTIKFERLGLSVSIPIPLSALLTSAHLTVSAVLRFRNSDTARLPSHNNNLTQDHHLSQFGHLENDNMLIEEKKLAVKLGQEEGAMGEQPPAYSQIVSSSSAVVKGDVKHPLRDVQSTSAPVSPGASTSSEPTIPPPSNFIHVFKRDANLNGTWHIDPSLTIPAAFSSPIDAESNYNTTSKFKLFDRGVPVEEQQRPPRPQPNLLLHTRDGRINADVWLRREPIPGQDVTKPTIIDLNSKDGSISLRLRNTPTTTPPDQQLPAPPTHIKIQTSDGHIRVFLPHTFQGPISHVLRDGKVVFSPKMQPHVTQFSIVGKKGKSFLGDWRSISIPEPDAKKPLVEGEARSEAPETPKDEAETPAAVSQWKGDSCEVETHDGSVYFYWEEEYEEAMTMKGWFRSLFW